MLLDVIAYRPLRRSPRLAALITAIGMSHIPAEPDPDHMGAPVRCPFPKFAIPEYLKANRLAYLRGQHNLVAGLYLDRNPGDDGGAQPHYPQDQHRQGHARGFPEQDHGLLGG